MKISIIIPVVNEAENISRSINRAWSSGADQVVVVDGGSSDSTVSMASLENCLLVASQPGRAIQMNRGANESDGEVLVFLHADNWLASDSCSQIRTAMENPACSFGAFQQNIENERAIYRWIESGNKMRVKLQGLIYGDQAFFIRRDVFAQVGGFPELELMEDFELSLRLRSLGKPVLLPGPTFVGARRWERNGPVRQTIRNWYLSLAYRMGAAPQRLAARYRRHDK